MLVHGSNPSANASGSGSEKQGATAGGVVLSSWLAGTPVPMSIIGLVRRRRHPRLPRAPHTALGAAPSELSELPRGVCWEAR